MGGWRPAHAPSVLGTVHAQAPFQISALTGGSRGTAQKRAAPQPNRCASKSAMRAQPLPELARCQGPQAGPTDRPSHQPRDKHRIDFPFWPFWVIQSPDNPRQTRLWHRSIRPVGNARPNRLDYPWATRFHVQHLLWCGPESSSVLGRVERRYRLLKQLPIAHRTPARPSPRELGQSPEQGALASFPPRRRRVAPRQ